MMIPLLIPTNNGFPWSQGDAGFRPSTVGLPVVPCLTNFFVGGFRYYFIQR